MERTQKGCPILAQVNHTARDVPQKDPECAHLQGGNV